RAFPAPDSHWRCSGALTGPFKPTTRLTRAATADLGWQDRPQGAALWHAAALFARITLSELAAIAARAEYYDDRDGFFSGAPQVLREGTLTLELHPAKQLIVKLEARHDIAGCSSSEIGRAHV